MTVDRDDALLDSLGRGDAPPAGDDVAMLLAAWRAEIADTPALRPVGASAANGRRAAGERPVPRPRGGPGGADGGHTGPGRRPPRRFARPLIVALATIALSFAGLAVASATAEPGSALWPITQLVWSERAESKAAEAQARQLLTRAREALAANRSQEAVQLVVRAAEAIDRVTDPVARQRLKQEAIDLLGRTAKAPAAEPGGAEGTPAPGGSPQPQQPSPDGTPAPTKTELLPPLLPGVLPSILPSWLPSLPLLP